MTQEMPGQRVSLLSIYVVFFQIGLMSFGGGLVTWIHREVVNVRGWIKDEEFLSGMALSQILPGVNSTNTAIFVGQRVRGAIGATVALVAMLTGPFVVVLVAGIFYQRLIGVPGVAAFFEGVAAVALGLIMRLGIQASRRAARSVVPFTVMVITFVTVGVLRWPMLPTVAVIAPLSILAAYYGRRRDA
jgi:chromate transporter